MRPVWAIEIPRSFGVKGEEGEQRPPRVGREEGGDPAAQDGPVADDLAEVRAEMPAPGGPRGRRGRVPDAESRHDHPRADDRGGDREGGPESFRRDGSAEARSQRHPEVKGGGVPPVRPPEEVRRAGIPHVGHHRGGEAGEPHPGENVDQPDVQGSPGHEQKEGGQAGDPHPGKDEALAPETVGHEAQREGEGGRRQHEAGVDHSDVDGGGSQPSREQRDQGEAHVGPEIQDERQHARDEDGRRDRCAAGGRRVYGGTMGDGSVLSPRNFVIVQGIGPAGNSVIDSGIEKGEMNRFSVGVRFVYSRK